MESKFESSQNRNYKYLNWKTQNIETKVYIPAAGNGGSGGGGGGKGGGDAGGGGGIGDLVTSKGAGTTLFSFAATLYKKSYR